MSAPCITLTANVNVALPAVPEAPPAGTPRAVLQAIGVSYTTGRLCGILLIGGTELPFIMGDDAGEALYELDEEIGYEINPNLARVLPGAAGGQDYADYLLRLLDTVEQALADARARLLDDLAPKIIERLS